MYFPMKRSRHRTPRPSPGKSARQRNGNKPRPPRGAARRRRALSQGRNRVTRGAALSRAPAPLLMALSTLLFAAMGVCVKFASAHYSTGEIVFYRGMVGALFMAALLRSRGHTLGTPVPGMHFWRSASGVTALSLWFYAIGGLGSGLPLRVTISAFGPTLLSKVLDLNDTQESSLGLIFHYADGAGLPLLDLADLRAVVAHLLSDEGKAELKSLGGLSTATAGVILRELIGLEDQGGDVFFGEPEFESSDLLQLAPDGRGLVSLVELPQLQDRPAIFSTSMMSLGATRYCLPPVRMTANMA